MSATAFMRSHNGKVFLIPLEEGPFHNTLGNPRQSWVFWILDASCTFSNV
jgi:hypothetical protein